MSSPVAVHPSPNKQQIAHAIAGALPAELSKSPVLGILGVVLGAGIVTLTGRMLTLGTADLKGSLGIGVDNGAWIGSAFNVALMFIGPFTVYVGGLLGPRRVLLAAGGAFTLICLFLPYIHSYSLLLTALVLAGLTSGTFYPLTLTFALRNIPLRFLPFTLALYATFVDAAVNLAPSWYGWYRDHLSYRWMFWNSALLTPIMLLCIFYGIPAARPQKPGAPPSFAGFLYAECRFRDAVCRIRSRTETGLVSFRPDQRPVPWRWDLSHRRAGSPASSSNPLIDLPYLKQWNTQLLGIRLMLFRFCLLSTIILVPQALAIHGFEADQIGPAILWTAVPQLPIAFIAALILLRGYDTRLMLALGFTCMAAACILNAKLTFAWSAGNFYHTELLMGVGQSFAFIGLVSTIVLQAIFSGDLTSRRTR